MKLYYSPGACSLSPHIVLCETGLDFTIEKVNLRTKETESGRDFSTINPKGYVPALVLDDGQVLTENVAVLSYISSLDASHRLAPAAGTLGFFRVVEWLSFINSEVHKCMSPMFRPTTTDEQKTALREQLATRHAFIEDALGDKAYLTGENFTVADAYLYVTLSWRERVGVDISRFPKLSAYFERCRARPSVQQARKAEGLPL